MPMASCCIQSLYTTAAAHHGVRRAAPTHPGRWRSRRSRRRPPRCRPPGRTAPPGPQRWRWQRRRPAGPAPTARQSSSWRRAASRSRSRLQQAQHAQRSTGVSCTDNDDRWCASSKAPNVITKRIPRGSSACRGACSRGRTGPAVRLSPSSQSNAACQWQQRASLPSKPAGPARPADRTGSRQTSSCGALTGVNIPADGAVVFARGQQEGGVLGAP